MPNGRVYQLIYPRHREWIFWAGFIQIREIYTDSPFSALLLHHYSVGQPLRIKNFFDSPCFLKLHHPLPNNISVFLRQTLMWLLFGSNGWVNVQVVIDEVRIDPWGLIGVPRKYIHIFFEKTN